MKYDLAPKLGKYDPDLVKYKPELVKYDPAPKLGKYDPDLVKYIKIIIIFLKGSQNKIPQIYVDQATIFYLYFVQFYSCFIFNVV